MKRLLFLIGLVGPIGLSGLIPPPLAAEVVDRVVAVVGTEVITLSDVKNYSAQRGANARMAHSEDPTAAAAAKDPLEALIREKLLKSEMQRLSVTASEDDINAAIQDVVNRNHISQEILKGEIAKKGMSFEQYKKDIGKQIEQMKFLSQVIFPRIHLTEEEVNRKAGPNASEETRTKARIELMQARSSEELVHYLDEARSKTYVEIKK